MSKVAVGRQEIFTSTSSLLDPVAENIGYSGKDITRKISPTSQLPLKSMLSQSLSCIAQCIKITRQNTKIIWLLNQNVLYFEKLSELTAARMCRFFQHRFTLYCGTLCSQCNLHFDELWRYSWQIDKNILKVIEMQIPMLNISKLLIRINLDVFELIKFM